MKYYTTFLVAFIMLIYQDDSYSQGCSDAGFCTIGSIKPLNSDSMATKKQTLSILLTNGIGDENVYVFTPGIQYDNKLNDQWEIQGKITGNYASGNLGKITGLGDLILSSSYNLKSKSNWKASLVLGTKIFLSDGNSFSDGKPTPMQYQSSLGTIDLLAGVSITNIKWTFGTALQQPLTGANRNSFLPTDGKQPYSLKYPPSNRFRRKGDLLVRGGYTITIVPRWKLNVGVLAIYHLGEDTYEDKTLSNSPISIKGSEGLTLNLTTTTRYTISDRLSLGLSGGFPVVVRTVRPDGLTRRFVVSPEISYKF